MSALLFVLIVAGMFVFAFIRKSEIVNEVIVDDSLQPVSEIKYPSITRVDAKHYFIDGVHTVVGELAMPTPCDLLESKALVAESNPEQITIVFSVINNVDVCAEKITSAHFKVSATASKEATWKAVFMGRPIDLNLIEADEGDTPDEFELFIKG